MKRHILRALLFTCLFALTGTAQLGGTFQITQSVVAGGGGNTSGGVFSLEGTIGQNISGTRSSGSGGSGNFTIQSGFWTSNPLGTTAANVTLTGRITSPDRIGVRRILVELTNADTGEIRSARPNTFGYFRFQDLPLGLYVLRGVSRNYSFSPEQTVISVNDDTSGIELIVSRIIMP